MDKQPSLDKQVALVQVPVAASVAPSQKDWPRMVSLSSALQPPIAAPIQLALI